MKEYIYKPGDRVIWLKTISRKKPFVRVPATFVRYGGSRVFIQPDRESSNDLLPKQKHVSGDRVIRGDSK